MLENLFSDMLDLSRMPPYYAQEMENIMTENTPFVRPDERSASDDYRDA
jgi:hypothetical protein